MKKHIAVVFLTCACLVAVGQDTSRLGNFPPASVAPSIYAVEAKENVIVDGKLNEAIWQKALPAKDFFRIEPRQGGKYLHETLVKVLYDKKSLYFGVFCRDSIGRKGVRVQDLRRDFSFGENDMFFLQLDPQNLKRFCVSFQTTPFGNQRDLQVFDDSFRDNDWDAWWKVRTAITDSGYYAEFAIPFVSLRYEKPSHNDSVSWGVTYSRLARRDYEQTVFPAVPQAFSPYRMTYAAQLKGLVLPPPSINLRVQPYTLFQQDNATNVASEKTSRRTFKAGGEIKWAVNPHAVLDLTFNTDFAQADVDRAINNLSRFNVFFPERRQFFLENSGVYAGANVNGVKPFFSRSIGLANTQFNADPVALDAGVRYADKNQQRTMAGLYVHQRGTERQGAANFGVLRYLQNYGTQNNVGVMVTHRLDEGSSLRFAERNNTTLTIDGLIRPSDTWTIQYLASASRDNSNDSIGFAGNLFVGYNAQDFYLASISKYVDEKYVPGMGFVFANNTIHHNPGGYYIWRPAKGWFSKWIRRQDPGLFVNWYQNANDFKTQEFSLYIFPIYLFTKTNAQFEYALFPTWQNFNFPFPILGRTVATGKYEYTRHLVRYSTDASKKVSGSMRYEFGGYYEGLLNTIVLGTRFVPVPNIALTADYEHNNFRNFGTTNDNFQTDLYTGGLRLAYDPRIQLSGFYQFNTFDKRGRWNIRGSWEFAPLSFFYIVFNQNSFRDSPVQNQSFISKLTYLKQF